MTKPGKCRWCESLDSELRKRTLANFSVQYVYQCLTCGSATSLAIRKAEITRPDSLRDFDEALHELYKKQCERDRLVKKAVDRAEWFQQHNAYLKSPEWRARRLAVLKRANGICEGCAGAVATQVHHLTYEHWGHEFLWELVAICDRCHEEIHPHMGEGRS
jgi:hypothetical protein